ncbi:MAG: metallophosphoesterase [Pseudomonadota bacterium]
MRRKFFAFATATVMGVVAASAPQLAYADNCLRMYKHAHYNGTEYKFCPGQSLPKHSRWNDEVSSIKVPSGYILAVYEHAGRRGKSRILTSSTRWVGESWNDKISSYKLVRGNISDCVRAYKDANYKGTRWDFCPSNLGLPKPDHGKWNDQISSVKVPEGKQVTFCEHVKNGSGKGRCRTFFENTSWIGSTLNDKFSYYSWGSFDHDSFTMAVISDTQYGYCEARACKDGPGNADKANEWHSDSIRKLARGTRNWAGVILNGDVTNVETMDEVKQFEKDYGGAHMNMYAGLGNHDYENYHDKWCAGDGNAVAKNYCTRRIMQWFEDHIESIPSTRVDLTKQDQNRTGSYAYRWDIGNYTFIQLNNHPEYDLDFKVYISSRVHKERYDINPSIRWLKRELDRISDSRVVVIHMHKRGTTRSRAKFLEALDRHPRVAAVFLGHEHELIGWDNRAIGSAGTGRKEWTTPAGKKIPYLFAGGAEWNQYLKVKFDRNRIVIEPIDSRWGKANTLPATVARTVVINH